MNEHATIRYPNWCSITGCRAYGLPQNIKLNFAKKSYLSLIVQVDTVVMSLVSDK